MRTQWPWEPNGLGNPTALDTRWQPSNDWNCACKNSTRCVVSFVQAPSRSLSRSGAALVLSLLFCSKSGFADECKLWPLLDLRLTTVGNKQQLIRNTVSKRALWFASREHVSFHAYYRPWGSGYPCKFNTPQLGGMKSTAGDKPAAACTALSAT